MRVLRARGEFAITEAHKHRLANSLRAGGALVISAVSAFVGYPPAMIMALVPAINLTRACEQLRSVCSWPGRAREGARPPVVPALPGPSVPDRVPPVHPS